MEVDKHMMWVTCVKYSDNIISPAFYATVCMSHPNLWAWNEYCLL